MIPFIKYNFYCKNQRLICRQKNKKLLEGGDEKNESVVAKNCCIKNGLTDLLNNIETDQVRLNHPDFGVFINSLSPA